jgi:hypothetical protein
LHGFDTRSDRDDPWFEIDELRQKLPAKGVLIDIVRFEVTDFQAKSEEQEKLPARYLAFLTTRSDDVQIVDLGPADAIEQAIQAARQELNAAMKHIREKGEPQAELELRQPMEALAQLVLHPLLPHAEQAEQWFISPDSNLWLVPWAALPLKDGRFAVEEYRSECSTARPGEQRAAKPGPRIESGQCPPSSRHCNRSRGCCAETGAVRRCRAPRVHR